MSSVPHLTAFCLAIVISPKVSDYFADSLANIPFSWHLSDVDSYKAMHVVDSQKYWFNKCIENKSLMWKWIPNFANWKR